MNGRTSSAAVGHGMSLGCELWLGRGFDRFCARNTAVVEDVESCQVGFLMEWDVGGLGRRVGTI